MEEITLSKTFIPQEHPHDIIYKKKELRHADAQNNQ